MFEYVCVSWDKDFGAKKFTTTDLTIASTWYDSEYMLGRDVIIEVKMDSSEYKENEWQGWIIHTLVDKVIAMIYHIH